MDLTKHIRTVPDFPAPGIMFRDVTTLFAVPQTFSAMIIQFKEQWQNSRIDYIAGIDARGFIIGGALAHDLNIGFVPLRKKGKLPYETITEDYELEYGNSTLEVHADAVPAGANVLVIDDLIATGGTAIAAIKLLQRLDARIVGCGFLVDLPDLGGATRIKDMGVTVGSLCAFEGH